MGVINIFGWGGGYLEFEELVIFDVEEVKILGLFFCFFC